MTEMRVVTVRQPHAWAIIHAGKDVENRVRNIAGGYRGRVAIHAGLAPYEQNTLAGVARDRAYAASSGNLRRARIDRNIDTRVVFGAIIGVVDLVGVHHADDALCFTGWAEPGVFHLELTNPRALTTPIPFKGALGLRRLPDTITAQIEQQLALAEGSN